MIPLLNQARQMLLWEKKWKPELQAERQSFLTDPTKFITHGREVYWRDITDPFRKKTRRS